MKLKHLLLICLVSAVINIALTPIAPGIAVYFGYLMLICFWSYALIWTGQNRLMKKSIVWLLMIIALAIVTSVPNFSSGDFRKKFISLASFISFYWMLSLPADRDSRHNIQFKHVYYSAIALTFIFAIYSFLIPSIAYTPEGNYGNLIFTMGLGNPNGSAVYVLFTSMILLLAFISTSRKSVKIVLLALAGVLTYILYLLSSRTVFACVLLAWLSVIFSPILRKQRIFRYAVLIAPLIMVIVQFFFNEKIGDYEILGKELDTGRYEMYHDLLQQIILKPMQYVFGNICGYNFQNFHNGLLTIFASLGIIGVVWAAVIWNNKLKSIEMDIQSPCQRLAYLFVLILLFDAIAESMTVIGTLPHGLFVYLMVKIAQGDVLPETQFVPNDTMH